MRMDITDPGVQEFVIAADELKVKYIREGDFYTWAGSPFAWIRTLPSRRIGNIWEELVSNDAHSWVIPKNVVLAHAKPQHGGKGGTDTLWLPNLSSSNPGAWLAEFGGTLEQASRVLLRIK